MKKFGTRLFRACRFYSDEIPIKKQFPIRKVLLPILVASVLGGYLYMDFDDKKLQRESRQKYVASTGSAKVGGTFTLVETKTGRAITDSEFRGKWLLVYFGFVHCPDICPTELKKMTRVLNKLETTSLGNQITPIFLSCDPARDSLDAIEKYLADYHPKFIGLTGTPSQISLAAKKFRVYYTGPQKEVDDGSDYNLDHSIFIYLMKPNGEYAECFNMQTKDVEIVKAISEIMKE